MRAHASTRDARHACLQGYCLSTLHCAAVWCGAPPSPWHTEGQPLARPHKGSRMRPPACIRATRYELAKARLNQVSTKTHFLDGAWPDAQSQIAPA